MKKKISSASFIVMFVLSVAFTLAAQKTPVKMYAAPTAPKFSDEERQSELARRRAEVGRRIGKGATLILHSAEPRIYTNDVDFMYRQENNLYYLTGLRQNGSRLVLVNDGTSVNEILFLPKRNPQFETWNGKMYSREEAARISGIKTIADAAEFEDFVKTFGEGKEFTSKEGISISTKSRDLYLLLPQNDLDRNAKREFRNEMDFARRFASVAVDGKSKEFVYTPIADVAIKNVSKIFGELRLIKSPYELKLLQHAIDITAEAQMRAWVTARDSKWEYETQAEIEYVFRKRNADYWGYPSIVGCGPNATTLHYVESQGEVKQGNLFLLDVGAEYDHYTADVTRTFPVSGKFSKEQAEIYQIVYDAQEAVAAVIKPGAKMSDIEKASRETLEKGLVRLGLIDSVGALLPGTEREITDAKGEKKEIGLAQSRIWAIHGNSHWLGMNVHDVGSYETPLAPGMVFTNEPGIYLREVALDYLPKKPETEAWIAKVRPVFEKYKNIGVRIEDDMLVTATGAHWMTKNLPRSIGDIERFMAEAPKNLASNFVPRMVEPAPFSLLAFAREPKGR